MTSSNFVDHQLAHRCDSSTVLTLDLPEDLFSQLERIAEYECRTIEGQILFILKRTFLNKGSALKWGNTTADVSVRAGDGSQDGCSSTAVDCDSDELPQSAVTPAVPPSSLSQATFGDGSREEPCKSEKPDKRIPQPLVEFEPQIHEFWKAKKGSKSIAAWNLLMKELSKLHDHLKADSQPGKQTMLDQFELATANRFNSITLKNYLQFAETATARFKPAEPQTAHPASKVFKASDLDWPDRTRETLPKIEGMPDIKNILPDF